MKLGLLCGLLFFIVVPSVSAAEGDFSIDVQTSYTVLPSESPVVKHIVNITNLRSQSYVKEYSFQINSNRIDALTVTGERGENLPLKTNSTTGTTKLDISFPEPIVGKGKSTQIVIEYLNPDAANELGNILELHIPKLSDPDKYNSFDTSVYIPKSYPPPSTVYPSPAVNDSDAALHRLTFTKEQLAESGAYVSFGEKQFYKLDLSYPLSNPSITPVEFQIVLPPDTHYQKVILESIDPQPQSIEPDADGNWLATYKLEAKQDITVEASLYLTVMAKPTFEIGAMYPSLNPYVTSQEYWPLDDAEVIATAAKSNSASSIYAYLLEHFSYNYDRVDNQTTTRLGAAVALANPQNSLCLEFADSFITLARKNHIPARLLTGFAHSENQYLRPLSLVENTLHAWPEYYDFDTKLWRAIDPTWGSTTGGIDYFNYFDTNHIVFAIQGSSSVKPLPAGMLPSGIPGGTIDVNFTNYVPEPTDEVSLDISTPLLTRIGFSRDIKLTLKNRGNNAVHNTLINVTDSSGKQLNTHQVVMLLPSMTYTTGIDISQDSVAPITISYLNVTKEIENNQNSTTRIGIVVFLLFTGFATAITLRAFRSRSVLVQK